MYMKFRFFFLLIQQNISFCLIAFHFVFFFFNSIEIHNYAQTLAYIKYCIIKVGRKPVKVNISVSDEQ